MENIGRGQGRAERKRRLNEAGSEQEGELETAKLKTIRVRSEIFERISNLRQTRAHKGLQAAVCVCAKDAGADQCTTS